ncbi:MAG: hypothetical protein HY690_06805 [Chloroflexi bacterium]|nr:hypothetical protein [Chloroflexota bacterium]
MSGRGRRYPSHLISPDEVKDWLADSVNKRITFHRTARLAAEEIIKHGVDISRSRIGAYGQGFYTTTDPEGLPGDTILEVTIRLLKPLVGDSEAVGSLADEVALRVSGRSAITRPTAHLIRQELLNRGYDGMIIRDAGGDGIDFVVALLGETVKVVER